MPPASSIPEGLISRTEAFDERTPLTKIVPAVFKYGAVVINRGGKYAGIIDSRALYGSMRGVSIPRKETASNVAVKVPRITDSTPLDDVIYYFYRSRAKALPYIKNENVKGMLRRQTVIKVMLSLNKLTDMKAGDAAISPLIGIGGDSTLNQAMHVMHAKKINRLAVLEGSRLSGLVTNHDIISKYAAPSGRLPMLKLTSTNQSLMLSELVQRNPVTIDYGKSLKEAAQLLVEHGVSSLIVTKSNKPVGMLTELDIITKVMASGVHESNRIFISGLNDQTYEFEDEMRSALKVFLAKMEKMKSVSVAYVSVIVKKFGSNAYELSAHVSLGKEGVLVSHTTGHIFERTFFALLGNLEREITKKREKRLTLRRVTNNMHAEEEEE